MDDNTSSAVVTADDDRHDEFIERASKLLNDGEWEDLGDVCEAYIAEEQNYSDAFFLRALAALKEENYILSAQHSLKALELEEGVSEYADLLAVVYSLVGELHKSMFYAKTAQTGVSRERARAWMSSVAPSLAETFSHVEEHPLLRQAIEAIDTSSWASAEYWFEQHIHFYPYSREGYLGLANCLSVQGFFRSAIEILRGGCHMLPNDAGIMSHLGVSLTANGQFHEGAACHRWAEEMAPDDAVVHARTLIDLQFDARNDGDDIIRMHRKWGEKFSLDPVPGVNPPDASPKEQLTVGYIIGIMDRSRVGPAFADIIANHDPDTIRAVGFGYGPLSSPANSFFQRSFSVWRDLNGIDPYTFSSMVTAEGIDILIDLNGQVMANIVTSFGLRMAPVQMTWLGSPCGTGLREMDYLVSDKFIEAGGQDCSLYSEKMANLELGSMVMGLEEFETPGDEDEDDDDKRPLTFAADASFAELNLPTVEAFAKILRQCPGSMLLLKDHDFSTEANVAQLIGMFGNFGVSHRIDIVSKGDSGDLFRDADICLMPYMGRRLDVAVDALSSGLPVVNWAGGGHYSRGIASALNSMGLAEETLAYSADEYVALAVKWARDEDRRAEFAKGIGGRLENSPFFDSKVRAADLEKLLKSLWDEAC